MNPPDSNFFARRYILQDQLGKGGMGVVYSAMDRLTGQVVALKRVTAPLENFLFASQSTNIDSRLALAREFRVLSSIRHPYIISVLDYGFDQDRQPFFTMELLQNAVPINEIPESDSTEKLVDILIQILQALSYLHRRGIVHSDLKPANILEQTGEIHVLDFGLSIVHEQNKHLESGAGGTIPYMAPELLQGATPSQLSDLYAVGVIAYELLTGQYPYVASSINELVQEILYTQPNLSVLGLNHVLLPILQNLLQKAPERRYTDANQVIAALNEAVGRPAFTETVTTRESFLQAARFVGRDDTLAQMHEALDQSTRGQGSAWLLGGESGVGKSRLLEELRSIALVEDVYVVRGQAVSQGAVPYQLWREVLRSLVLLTTLDPFEASILKSVVPDLEHLLGNKIEDAPLTDPETTQSRLMNVVETLLVKQGHPLVIILEDIHWAGSENLILMNRVARLVPKLPLLVLASYRDDEQPSLPGTLSNFSVLKLNRLTEENIRILSQEMLGQVGQMDSVVKLLQRETEGNIFFVIETVRALAEEAGQLDKIAEITLPNKVSTGNIQRLIERRLNRIAESDRPLLELAAVYGRQLDLDLLRAVSPTSNLTDWLNRCANAAVLDVQEQNWRFAHDKLRDGLVGNLSPSVRQHTHQQIAENLEQIHPNSPDQYAALAYHWTASKNQQKAVHYLMLAGEQAYKNGAFQEALTSLHQALSFIDDGIMIPQNAKAHLLHILGQTYGELGLLVESRKYIEGALALFGMPVPQHNVAVVLDLLRQLALRVVRPLWIHSVQTRPADKQAYYVEMAVAQRQIAEIHYFANRTLHSLRATLCALNLAEKAGPSPIGVRIYAALSIAAGIFRLHNLAEVYVERARNVARQLAQPLELAYALHLTSTYTISMGQWKRAEQDLKQAIQIYRQLRNKRELGVSLSLLASVYTYQGQYAPSLELHQELYELAVDNGNVQQQLWSLTGQALALLNLGRFSETIVRLHEALPKFEGNTALHSQIIMFGLLGAAELATGNFREAAKFVQEAEKLIVKSTPTMYAAFEGCGAAVDVLLALHQHSHGLISQHEARDSVIRIAKVLRRYGTSFPIARPRALLTQGSTAWLQNKPAKAMKAWRESLKWAERLQMPYDAAQAYYQLGAHQTLESPHRDEYLHCAHDLFSQIGAAHDLAQVELLWTPQKNT